MNDTLPQSTSPSSAASSASFVAQPETTRADADRGSSFAAELARDKKHRERARTIQPLRRLLPFILRYPRLLLGFTFFLFAASVLTLMLPGAFRLVVDCGFGGAEDSALCAAFPQEGSLSIFFIIGIVGAVLLGLTSAMRFYFISLLGERVVADLRVISLREAHAIVFRRCRVLSSSGRLLGRPVRVARPRRQRL